MKRKEESNGAGGARSVSRLPGSADSVATFSTALDMPDPGEHAGCRVETHPATRLQNPAAAKENCGRKSLLIEHDACHLKLESSRTEKPHLGRLPGASLKTLR
ncbi:hypothetical protein SKAU_G00013800 [Synaphobranchus kaupii]|uniref:Uncharacterized protein n=1 Tax=Synaphobranchus kaupii TaxID=118154 RepID=A0A9Q1GAR4_SYNKA|nr:hypothetical protein SKAU_G00013800 [Synaphobranchus kaupii]